MSGVEFDVDSLLSSIAVSNDKVTNLDTAREFIKDNLIKDIQTGTVIHEDEAEIAISNNMKTYFGFNRDDCRILLKYYKRITVDHQKPIKKSHGDYQNRGSKKQALQKHLLNKHDEVNGECDDQPDPEDIDADESCIDPSEIEKADIIAERILSRGEPIKYIMKTVSKTHVGDENTIEAMCVSIGGQACLNTAGIQINVNGESGSGKSHGAKSLLHLIPKRYKRSTSLSAKALYYMELRPGMIVFSDDTDMDVELQSIFKQSTTNYQEETHRTTVKDQKKQVITIPPRINLMLTSVESHVSDQVLNRQLTFETDISGSQKLNIFGMQQKTECDCVNPLDVTFRVLVCRRIFSKIKDQMFNVYIPFADKINLEDYSNSRIFPLICDMIRGFTIFKYKQRSINNKGWLVAEHEDFYRAKKLFKSREENTVTKLTAPEREIVKYIINHQRHDGCTINDVSIGTGIKYQTVTRLINGRSDRSNDDGGLLSKVKGMRKEDTTITTYIREGDELIESRGKKDYRYKIIDYNPWDLFANEFITLKI